MCLNSGQNTRLRIVVKRTTGSQLPPPEHRRSPSNLLVHEVTITIQHDPTPTKISARGYIAALNVAVSYRPNCNQREWHNEAIESMLLPSPDSPVASPCHPSTAIREIQRDAVHTLAVCLYPTFPSSFTILFVPPPDLSQPFPPFFIPK